MNRDEKLLNLSKSVFSLARDGIIVNLRFLDVALSKLTEKAVKGYTVPVCDLKNIFYDPEVLLKQYKLENAYVMRLYLHILFHCIFNHAYFASDKERKYWDLACDIATENIILGLNIKTLALNDDVGRKNEIKILNKNSVKLTAEKIYSYFLTNGISFEGEKRLKELFTFDDHRVFYESRDEKQAEEFLKLSERIKADIGSFTKKTGASMALSDNLEEVTKERYNYEDILKHFTVMGEDLGVNDDEFDYIYYTFGLKNYGNMPLIEPLEYKDVKKVKEFVIAIDTSASTKGSTVRTFLNKTYNILKSTESFFTKVNIHIIECDNEIREDIKISSDADFEEFLKNGKLTGFGGTDFRPVFSYVDALIENGEFENLKGLIYFTDGFGIYPEHNMKYDTMFVFLNEDEKRFVPPWAIKVILDGDELNDN